MFAAGLIGCADTAGDLGDSTPPAGTSRDLVRVTPVAAGRTCPAGGTEIAKGQDLNGDQALGDDEVTERQVVCNGLSAEVDPNAAPSGSLVRVAEADADTCPHGGLVIMTGPDLDADGILSEEEVTSHETVCALPSTGERGKDGADTLLRVTGVSHAPRCDGYALRIESGIDLDGDGALSDDEVQHTEFLCDGEAGTQGPRGHSALLRTTRKITLEGCPAGGVLIETGLDLNGNGKLDDAEVSHEERICDGADGRDGSTVGTATAGRDGRDGTDGKDGRDGVDGKDGANGKDGVNGTNGRDGKDGVDGKDGKHGLNTLLRFEVVTSEARCAQGGFVVESGLDLNTNGKLDGNEVTHRETLCLPVMTAPGSGAERRVCAGNDLYSADARGRIVTKLQSCGETTTDDALTCAGNDVVRAVSERGCAEQACVATVSQLVVERCEHGCAQGKCTRDPAAKLTFADVWDIDLSTLKPISMERALARFAPGAARAELSSFEVAQRYRRCHALTGCGDWTVAPGLNYSMNTFFRIRGVTSGATYCNADQTTLPIAEKAGSFALTLTDAQKVNLVISSAATGSATCSEVANTTGASRCSSLVPRTPSFETRTCGSDVTFHRSTFFARPSLPLAHPDFDTVRFSGDVAPDAVVTDNFAIGRTLLKSNNAAGSGIYYETEYVFFGTY